MGDDIIARLLLKIETMGQDKLLGVGAEAKAAGAEADGFGPKFAKAGALAAIGFAAAAAGAVAFSLDQASAFQEAMDKVHGFAGASSADMEYYRKSILATATQLGTSATNMANGLYYVVSAGFAGKAAMDVLKASTMASAASGASFTTVADGVTTALNAYHLSGTHAMAVTDMLSASVVHGKTTFEELAPGIARPLTVAPELGAKLYEVGGAMATLTDHGFSARLAGMQLTTMFRSMLAPTAAMQKASEGLGAQWEDLYNVKAHGLIPTLQAIDQLAHKNATSTAEYHQNLKDLLGNAAALQAFLALAGDGFKSLKTNVDAVRDSTGTTANAFKLHMDTMRGAAQQLWAGVQNLAIEFGTDFLPAATKGIQEVTKFVEYVGQHKKDIEDFANSVKDVAQQYATAAEHSKDFQDDLRGIQQALQSIGGSLNQFGKDIGLVGDSTKKAGDDSRDFQNFLLWFASFIVNGTLVAPLQALAFLIRGVANAFDDLVRTKQALGAFWNDIGSEIAKVISWFEKLPAEIPKIVSDMVQAVIGLFTGLWHTLVGGSIVPDMINAIIMWFEKLPAQVPGIVAGMVGAVIGEFAGLAASVLGQIGNMVGNVVSRVTSMGSQVAGQLHSMASQAASIVAGMASTIAGDLSSLAGQAFAWGANIAKNFASGLSSMVGAVASAAGAVLGAAKAALSFLSPNKLGDDPEKWGKNFGMGFAAGLGAGTTVAAVGTAAQNALNAAKSALTSADAITQATQAGAAVGQAFAAGIALGIAAVLNGTGSAIANVGNQVGSIVNGVMGGNNPLNAIQNTFAQLFSSMSQGANSWVTKSLDALAEAIKIGANNINQLAQAAVVAAQHQQANTDALDRATIKVDLSLGNFKDAIDKIQQKVDTKLQNAIDKYAYDLVTHSGNLKADAQAIAEAKLASDKWTVAVQTATNIADQFNASFGRAASTASDAATTLARLNATAADTITPFQSTAVSVSGLGSAATQAASAMQTFLQQIQGSNSLSSLIPTDPGQLFAFMLSQLQSQLTEAQNTYAYDLINNPGNINADAAAILTLQQQIQQLQAYQKQAQSIGVPVPISANVQQGTLPSYPTSSNTGSSSTLVTSLPGSSPSNPVYTAPSGTDTQLQQLQQQNTALQDQVSSLQKQLADAQAKIQLEQQQLDALANIDQTLVSIEKLNWDGFGGMDVSSDHGLGPAISNVSTSILANRG